MSLNGPLEDGSMRRRRFFDWAGSFDFLEQRLSMSQVAAIVEIRGDDLPPPEPEPDPGPPPSDDGPDTYPSLPDTGPAGPG
jgi:hypothetical protein